MKKIKKGYPPVFILFVLSFLFFVYLIDISYQFIEWNIILVGDFIHSYWMENIYCDFFSEWFLYNMNYKKREIKMYYEVPFYTDEDLKWDTPPLRAFHSIHLSVTVAIESLAGRLQASHYKSSMV